ncbi:MAG: hypothetical protein ACP5RF_03840 [Candidatus Micrarchaeia archaeon]
MEEVHNLKDALRAVKRNDLYVGLTAWFAAFAGSAFAYSINPKLVTNVELPIFARVTEVFIPALFVVHLGVSKYLVHLENLNAKG